jgi:hypothetical protein
MEHKMMDAARKGIWTNGKGGGEQMSFVMRAKSSLSLSVTVTHLEMHSSIPKCR